MVLSADEVGLEALRAGRDAHKDAYARAFSILYEAVTKAQRDSAKAYNYGLLYGRGADSLARGRQGHREDAIPREVVQDYINRFLSKFEGYGEWRKVIEDEVRKTGCTKTAWGRPRYWYTRAKMPEAYNFPISGNAAHMMYEALIELDAQLPNGSELCLTVHDEVVINAPREFKTLRQTLECTRDVMERVFPQITEASLKPNVVRKYYPNGWFCESDCHIGTNWKMTKGATQSDITTELELRKTLGVEDLF